MKQKEI